MDARLAATTRLSFTSPDYTPQSTEIPLASFARTDTLMSDQHTNAHGEEAPNSDVHHLKGQATSSTLRPSNSNSSEKASTPPFSNWFLDKNKTMNAARGNYIKIYFGGSFFIVLAIFSMFSIFWGALWRAPTRHLPGWVVVRRSSVFFVVTTVIEVRV